MKVRAPEFPSNGLGVPVTLVMAEVDPVGGFTVSQVRVGVMQLLAPDRMVQEAGDGVRVPDIAPVLVAEPTPLSFPPLLPLQTQVVVLLDAGKAVLVEAPLSH